MKVCILPSPSEFKSDIGGAPRVVADLIKYLPQLGVEVVADPHDADIVHSHAVTRWPYPDVYTNHAYWRTPRTDWEKRAVGIMRKSLIRAKIVTSVSSWTPRLYENELKVKARVIRNGVPVQSLGKTRKGKILEEYGLDKPYFLWAKSLVRRVDACQAVIDLAIALPEYPFITTFAPEGVDVPSNVIVTGPVTYKKMKMMLKDCFALIATEKECFSVMNIEAMAMGKAIIGWDHGGTAEVVENNVNGYLLPVREPLISCIPLLLKHHKKWEKNAREMAKQYDLKTAILPQYIECYEEIMESRSKIKVTIIITCYNKEKLIEKAVMSALSQRFSLPFEVIVVDDCSTDGSRKILKDIQEKHHELRLVFNDKNVNAAPCRNLATEMANGQYCVSLDGDDWIDQDYLEALYPAIDADSTIGIAYSGQDRFGIDRHGDEYSVKNEPKEWDYELLRRHNYIPSCSMYRKEAWKQAGEYPNLGGWEDYALWLGIGGKGYKGVAVPGVRFHYYEELANRAFRSAQRGEKLRSMIHSLYPDYIGPDDDSIRLTDLYLKGRQDEIDSINQPELEPEPEPKPKPILKLRPEPKPVLEPAPVPLLVIGELVEVVEIAPETAPVVIETAPVIPSGPPRLRYMGSYLATVIFYGDVTKKRYSFSRNMPEFEVNEKDILGLLAKVGLFERIR